MIIYIQKLAFDAELLSLLPKLIDMSFIVGILKFIILFFLILLAIGFFALRRLQKKAREQFYRMQNPQEYQQEHMGDVEIEKSERSIDDSGFDDYEEIK